LGDVVAFLNLRIHLPQDLRDRRGGDTQVTGGLRQGEAESPHQMPCQIRAHHGEGSAPPPPPRLSSDQTELTKAITSPNYDI